MRFIIKLSPEITIKSKNVRIRFIKILTNNIRNILQIFNKDFLIIRNWDNIEIYIGKNFKYDEICNLLINIPGIHHILEVEKQQFITIHDIFEVIYKNYVILLKNKTFCVRVKRSGKHNFSSIEVERYIGKMLKEHIKFSNVKLKNQDITINLEIKDNVLILIKSRFEGIGGFPIGTQGNTLLLISGGVDSGVSSYMLMRRGCCVNYCFFRIGGIDHENKVKEIAYYLWNRFGRSHSVNFFIVNFEFIITEIVKKINNSQMGIILKRMMIKIASIIAKRYNIQSITTGESLGQVSSQTLCNLNIINSASDLIVLRPLISYDKENIIKLSKQIGIERFVNDVPEYCSIVSKNPTIKAIKSSIEIEESKFDFNIINSVINNIKRIKITEIKKEKEEKTKKHYVVETTTNISTKSDVIIDIRTIDEYKTKPLLLNNVEIIHIPFYNLTTEFSFLSKDKIYLLYCGRGFMSRLQALYLKEQGFNNIKIYLHKLSTK